MTLFKYMKSIERYKSFPVPLCGVHFTDQRLRDYTTYIPRRALLYVPADDTNKITKSFQTDADCIMLDCEDGVALSKKAQARLNIREFLDKGKPERKRVYDLAVRCNGVESTLIEQDLNTILSGKNLPDTIFLPKVDSTDHLKLFSECLEKFIEKKEVKLQLIIGIESAIAVVDCTTICQTAINMSKTSKFVPVALLFGSDDFCASIGARRSDDGKEVLYARQKIIVQAKAFNLQAIDMVYIKIKDIEGLRKQAEHGIHLGYTGKQVIHPLQVAPVQEIFMPTKEQIKWASKLLKAFYQNQQAGEGVFVHEGNMIDMPTVRQAQNIMDIANAVMIREP